MRKRLPEFREVVPVYSVIAFIVYSWAIIVFLWNLSAWLFYLYLDEILVVFAYRMVASLAESLFVLFVLLAVCFALPARFLKEEFVLRGTPAVICALGSVVLFRNHPLAVDLYVWLAGSILLAVLVAYISPRVKVLASFLRWLSDSMTIFVYILLPLSLVSLLVIVIRNVL